MADSPAPKLPLSDWLVIACIVGFLSALTLISLLSQRDLPETAEAPQTLTITQLIPVSIAGAVEHPGAYEMPKGSSLADLLEKAVPSSVADLSKLKGRSKLSKWQHVSVPEVEWVTVHIKGAVSGPSTCRLVKGSVVADLLPLIQLNPEANPAFFAKRRKLKDQETVQVPRLRSPPSSASPLSGAISSG